jgi:hypothetical protein
MFDFSHPFFRPLWLRLLIVALTLGWTAVEVATGNPGWAVIFGALGAVAVWGLLITYDPEKSRPKDGK